MSAHAGFFSCELQALMGTLQKQKGYFNPARVISVAALCAYILIEYSKHQLLIIPESSTYVRETC